MHQRNRDAGVAKPTRLARSTLAYGTVLTAALLCACSGGSNWRSSSALSSTPRTATANPEPSHAATVGSTTSAGRGVQDATAARTAASAAPTGPPAAGAAPAGPRAQDAASPAAAGAATGAAGRDTGGVGKGNAASDSAADAASSAFDYDRAAAASLHGQGEEFSDDEQFASDGSDGSAQPRAGSLAAGAGSARNARSEGSNSNTQAGANAASRGGAATGRTSSAAAGGDATTSQTDAGSGGKDVAGAKGDARAAGNGGAQAGGKAAQADADASSHAGTAATGQQADATNSADRSRGGAAVGSAALERDAATLRGGSDAAAVTAAAAPGAAAPPPDIASGLVEAPGKSATRKEEVIPLTLGGMLPLTLGIDGQGEFDFDKAVLREQVREQLDTLVARLKEADYDRLEIVGHTDRIGTADYNQYLSERRAWAVARYLVDQGVPASKIRVEGRGMHEPMTPLDECDGQLNREQLITCLQKDRRVVISASIRKVDVKVQ